LADATEDNGGPVDQAAVVDMYLYRGAGDGEVALPVAVLDKGIGSLPTPDADLSHQLAGLQRRREGTEKEIRQRQPALALPAAEDDVRAQGDERGGELRGGIGVGHAPAHRPTMPDGRMANLAHRLDEERAGSCHVWRAFEGGLTHRPPHGEPAILPADLS